MIAISFPSVRCRDVTEEGTQVVMGRALGAGQVNSGSSLAAVALSTRRPTGYSSAEGTVQGLIWLPLPARQLDNKNQEGE